MSDDQAELKEVTGARRLMIEAIGAPIVDWLMDQPPTIAMDSLLLVTATLFMSMKYKEGATPLTMLDSYTNSLRTTLTTEMETRAKEQELKASDPMPSTKPHYGRIEKWHRVACESSVGPDLGFFIMGTLMEHPTIPVKHITSMVVKHDEATGEIETSNSRYTLVGPEVMMP